MQIDVLNQFNPSSEPLLKLVFQQVDDSMLREISEADYGNDRDEHLKHLYEIKAGKYPTPMIWVPGEVLELIRFSQPEDPKWKPGSTGERGHWMRLFSCAVLIRAEVEHENSNRFIGVDTTVIQLIDSAIKLSEEVQLDTVKFLCWRLQARALEECDRMYFATAVLILLVSLKKCNIQTAQYLVGKTDWEQILISEELNTCLYNQKWARVIRNILIESKNVASYISKIGENLVSLIRKKAETLECSD